MLILDLLRCDWSNRPHGQNLFLDFEKSIIWASVAHARLFSLDPTSLSGRVCPFLMPNSLLQNPNSVWLSWLLISSTPENRILGLLHRKLPIFITLTVKLLIYTDWVNMDEQILLDRNFPLFAKPKSKTRSKPEPQPEPEPESKNAKTTQLEKFTNPDPNSTTTDSTVTFAGLGLAEWAIQTCKELGMRRPTPVQTHCIPKILEGKDVLGLAQTGSGKTAAFALPILHRLAEDPYGVLALVITPTRELAYQLAEQFKALGSGLHLRCEVVVGGMDLLTQAKSLMNRPHVVIATPGRIKVLLEEDPDIPPVFSRTKVRGFLQCTILWFKPFQHIIVIFVDWQCDSNEHVDVVNVSKLEILLRWIECNVEVLKKIIPADGNLLFSA